MRVVPNCLIPCPTDLYFCVSQKQFDEVLASAGIEDSCEWIAEGKHATTHTYENRSGLLHIICMHVEESDLDQEIALLVHEVTHVWRNVREFLGERDPSREFEAYSMQFLTLSLLKLYSERTGKLEQGKAPKSFFSRFLECLK